MVALVCCSVCTFLPVVFMMLPCACKKKQNQAAAVTKKKVDPKEQRKKSEKHHPAAPKQGSDCMKKNVEKGKKDKSKRKTKGAAVIKQVAKPDVRPKMRNSNEPLPQDRVALKNDAEMAKVYANSKDHLKQELETQQGESESKPFSSESDEDVSSKRVEADEVIRRQNRRNSIIKGIKEGFYVTQKEAREMKKTLDEYKDPEEEQSDMNQGTDSNTMPLKKEEINPPAQGKRVKKRLDERALFEEEKKKRRALLQQQGQKTSAAPQKESSSSNRKRQRKNINAAKKVDSNSFLLQRKKMKSKEHKKEDERDLAKAADQSLLNGLDQGLEKNKEPKSSSSSRNKEMFGVEGNNTGISGSADASPAGHTSPAPPATPLTNQRRKLNKGDDVMPRKRAPKKRMDELELYKYGNPKELKRLGFMAPRNAKKQDNTDIPTEITGIEVTTEDGRNKNE